MRPRAHHHVEADLGAELQLTGLVAAAGNVGDAHFAVVQPRHEIAFGQRRAAAHEGAAATDAAAVVGGLAVAVALEAHLAVLAFDAQVKARARIEDEGGAGIPADVVHPVGVVQEGNHHPAAHLESLGARLRVARAVDGLRGGNRWGERKHGREQEQPHDVSGSGGFSWVAANVMRGGEHRKIRRRFDEHRPANRQDGVFRLPFVTPRRPD